MQIFIMIVRVLSSWQRTMYIIQERRTLTFGFTSWGILEEGNILLKKISTTGILANMLTKVISRVKFNILGTWLIFCKFDEFQCGGGTIIFMVVIFYLASFDRNLLVDAQFVEIGNWKSRQGEDMLICWLNFMLDMFSYYILVFKW